MNAYQNFLDFFSMCNKERLDGLNEGHFSAMTHRERDQAFDFLLERIRVTGGSRESINGLFAADYGRAAGPVARLLAEGKLSSEAQIAAASRLWGGQDNDKLLAIFIEYMASPDAGLREMAVGSVPVTRFTKDLEAALRNMIRSEPKRLGRIHAVNALLELYGVTKESTDRKAYMAVYRGLHSDDAQEKETALRWLDNLYEG